MQELVLAAVVFVVEVLVVVVFQRQVVEVGVHELALRIVAMDSVLEERASIQEDVEEGVQARRATEHGSSLEAVLVRY